MLSDSAFIRYQRLICLPEVTELGQQQLCEASVVIIGCGGLGNAAALYLAASGIGKLVICDDDDVEVSNLTRQIAFRSQHISMAKVDALAQQLRELNPECHVRTVKRRMDSDLLPLEIAMADLVLDCSDNLSTRHTVNKACFDARVPLISGAAIGWNGQVIAFDFSSIKATQGCYACMVPTDQDSEISSCTDFGIVGPVVGTIGNLQALLALQYLIGLSEFKPNRLHQFDGKNMQWNQWGLLADPCCPVCAATEIVDVTNNNEESSCL